MSNIFIKTSKAPAAIGPYSQAVVSGDWIFVSGQIALEPEKGELRGTTASEQIGQIMHNLEAILAEAGAGFNDVVKTTIYLKDIRDFQAVNEIYGQHFQENKPARATIEVSNLPKGALVEVELIARIFDSM
jgi:2-iminobutanoate/2-iminopropanoate deaminase